jgi:pimeloyl-ACP methyl ester carboxylesterase
VILPHRTQSARARAVLPFARHVDLPRCGHLPFHDDPTACADLVLADAESKEAR